MTMDSDNVKEWKELLEKWKNFKKVYDAIYTAFHLGYEEGIEVEKYCEKMRKAETIDINNMPSAE